MTDSFTHFSCLIDVGTADKSTRALVLFLELRAAEQEADNTEVAGFDLVRQDAPEGSTLWIHNDESGHVEAVIRFVLHLAEEPDLTGLWGFQYGLTCSHPRLDAFGSGARKDNSVTGNKTVREMECRIRELKRQLGRKTIEMWNGMQK